MMKTDGHVFRLRRQRRAALAVAVATGLFIPLLYPAQRIIADDNEVIVSVEIVELESSTPVETGTVRFQPSSGQTQTVGHGQHATVEEGDFVALEARLPSNLALHHWEGLPALGGNTTTLAFREDTVVRLVVVSLSDESGDDANDSESATLLGPGGGLFPGSSTTTDSGEQTASSESRSTRSVTVIWVDFQHLGIEDGTQTNPFNTAAEGVSAVNATTADTINFQPGVSQETISINSAMTLDAPNGTARIGVGSFAVSYTLSTSVSGSGSVSGAGGYIEGSNATVSASPSSGWAFSHWEGDLAGFANPDAVLMDRDKSITGVFVQNPANLEVTTVAQSGGGALPTEAKAGDAFTLEWEVLNDSGNTASSGDTDWTDNVFLSRDAAFDGDDKALNATGTTITGPIDGGNTYMASVSITIPDASPGDYFLLVRTDTGDEVTHTASDRVAGISSNPITLIDPELTQ